ncbi:hypothetical protein UA08_09446 [Talaromyces atroroseus]|uniref:Uncharacterized protein n=1 Tax=Talaromyces atroroseus TaxID=1441469 RepID=A0A225AEI7_TALAT|nr:hypothetical protein UA08_09446 [Talaromyces atroroseus]OKL55278.1 hypothetical protein UA08_09446 [Talaromyces atroroseus]
MNLPPSFNVLMMCSVLILTESINAYDQVYGPIRFYAWDQPHCKGNCTVVNFDDAPLYYMPRNVSNSFVAHSFRLDGRGLAGKEQLDLSVALNESYSTGLDRSTAESSYCTHFLRSYTGLNGSMDCHDVPPFTCQRLWINRGLPDVSLLPSDRSTMVTDFTCQTIPLLPNSAWPTGFSSSKLTASTSRSTPALPSTIATNTSPTASSSDLSTMTTTYLAPTVTGHVLVVVSPKTTYTTTYF